MAKVAAANATPGTSTPAPPPVEMGGGDDSSQDGGPVSSFQSLQAEGELLAKQGDLRKAIEAYTKVIGGLFHLSFIFI